MFSGGNLMKLCRNLAVLFVSMLCSVVLLTLILPFGYASSVVYGDMLNEASAAGLSLTPGTSTNASPGETVTYTHTLSNTGDVTDTFTVTVTSSKGFVVNVNPSSVTLDKDAGAVLTATIVITPGAAINTVDEMTITAQSANDPGETDSATNFTTVGYNVYLPFATRPAIWESVGSNWPSQVTGRSLAVCDTDPNIILAGTIDNGVQIFGGTSWAAAASVPTGYSVTGLVMNQDCDLAYASLYDQGVWQGQKSGSVWAWSQLGGNEVLLARALALAGDRPFAGGDFGIRYWDGSSWQTTNGISGSQPVMDVLAANPQDSNSVLYAVQWQNGKVYQAFGNSPAAWSMLSLPDVPSVDMRTVFGTSTGVSFVGTQTGSYQLINNNWQLLPVSAGLRSGALDGTTAYLGYTSNAGVYKMQGNILGPLNSGWNTPPEYVYGLVLADGQLYAATSTGVWVYSRP